MPATTKRPFWVDAVRDRTGLRRTRTVKSVARASARATLEGIGT